MSRGRPRELGGAGASGCAARGTRRARRSPGNQVRIPGVEERYDGDRLSAATTTTEQRERTQDSLHAF